MKKNGRQMQEMRMSRRSETAVLAADPFAYNGYAAQYYSKTKAGRRKISRTEAAKRRLARRKAAMLRRLFAAVIGALIIFFFGLCIGNNHVGAANKPVNKYFTNVVVERGDTIWSLADDYIGDYEVNKNDYVKEICRMNNIPNGEIHPGDNITMIYYSTDVK